ncbi:MAG: hypothetical protein ACTSXU_00555 [Promethearchaeota archaeon]
MNYFKRDALIASLKKLVSYHEIETGSDNGGMIFSEYGGRLLGIFPRDESVNLLWTNMRLSDEIENKRWNIGGNRYWISPEQVFFYKDPVNWDGWFCPSGLDPASYQFTEVGSRRCRIESKIFLTNQMTGESFVGRVEREFLLIREPIKSGLVHCGVEVRERCEILSSNFLGNSWSLTQVISGGVRNPGTVIIPTKDGSKPLSYFRVIPADRVKELRDHVAFKIDVDDIYKLAIRPEDLDFSIQAKIGYVLKYPVGTTDDYIFIVKLSNDLPWDQSGCHDISRDHPGLEKGVVQSYNSESPDKPALSFGEIELQLDGFKSDGEKSVSRVRYQLFAYLGEKDEILELIRRYMHLSDPYLYE